MEPTPTSDLGPERRADQTWRDGTLVAERAFLADGTVRERSLDPQGTIVETIRPRTAEELAAVAAATDTDDRRTRKQRAAAAVAALDQRAAFYRSRPNASTQAEALAYINTMKDDLPQLFELIADIIRATSIDAPR